MGSSILDNRETFVFINISKLEVSMNEEIQEKVWI